MAYYCMYCGKTLTTADKIDRCFDCPKNEIKKTLSDYDLIELQKKERQEETDKLRSENKRLKKALNKIIVYYKDDECPSYDLIKVVEIVHEALKEVKE